MAIPAHMVKRFDALKRACIDGKLALLECQDAKSGEPRYVLCAVNQQHDESLFVPFAHMTPDDNPYKAYIPPTP